MNVAEIKENIIQIGTKPSLTNPKRYWTRFKPSTRPTRRNMDRKRQNYHIQSLNKIREFRITH